MSVFIDTNVIVYANLPSDFREPCLEILEAVARSGIDGRTSTAVVEEIWHLELNGKAGKLDGLTQRIYTLFTPLLPVDDEIVAHALTLDTPRLGANDRIHLATALANGIATILSADADFDGAPGLRRIDPLDRAALARLLGSRP